MEIQNIYSFENSKFIYSKEHLIDLIGKYKFDNVGLTSGCFDILHKGHINNLKLAKNNCNKLFVCLSSDKQIKDKLVGTKVQIKKISNATKTILNQKVKKSLI